MPGNLGPLQIMFSNSKWNHWASIPNKNSKYQHTGQIIFGGYGPTAQHSYFQLLHQGTQNICADIIACSEDVKA
jgi:glucose-6-phosphate isomerase